MMYIDMFIRRCRKEAGIEFYPTASSRSWGSKQCVRAVQESCFSEEQHRLQSGDGVLTSSRLFRLKPFVDSEGLIRVGGRLERANLTFDARHPPILPSRHALATLFIRGTHEHHLHAGLETTLLLTCGTAWIIDGRQAVRRVIGQCVICQRYRSQAPTVPMAPLLECRVNRPPMLFTHVGLDCFGPIFVSVRRSQEKRWVTIFTCLASRAVHLVYVTHWT
ncbi:hypothetical protein TTRE_0000946801 [Trichuris trichiura]|uniref:Integrase zinc-binding domain-containing protein n=1 Tax=Trichuris trichiura TaxID=36087 RepID=A0A077ZMS1_TRITR|nr:hypothetical protein TTRE_0000946801 [Trichuris trichiura]